MKYLKYSILLIVFSTVISCAEDPKPVADNRKSDYALYDADGGFHRFSYYNDHKAIVLFIQGNGCPIVRNALEDFNEIVDEYSEDFKFFMLNSNMQDSRKTIKEESDSYKFEVPVLVDNAQILADQFDLNITAEILILHPTSRKIIYRGPINNRLDYGAQKNEPTERYLRDALTSITKEETPISKQEMTRGCTVTRRAKLEAKDTLTYTKDIAPILIKNCVQCHREGGQGPWKMDGYQTVAGWSAMIKEVLISKRMPPYKADPEIGNFSNNYGISDPEARKIIKWIDNGLEAGLGNDTLTKLQFNDIEWMGGTPDIIHTMDLETIPATKNIPDYHRSFSLNLDRDVWLKSVEIHPGNPEVLHHIILTKQDLNPEEAKDRTDNYLAIGNGQDFLTDYPEGTGIFLKKGTKINASIHYNSIGKETTDQTTIGFSFHETPPKKQLRSKKMRRNDISIDPFERDHKKSISFKFNEKIKVFTLIPHMHYRGKDMKILAKKPDEKQIPLVSVADYDFGYQYIYKLKEPLTFPKNTEFEVRGTFDNSYQNPLNPDPTKKVKFGNLNTNEMFIGYITYVTEE